MMLPSVAGIAIYFFALAGCREQTCSANNNVCGVSRYKGILCFGLIGYLIENWILAAGQENKAGEQNEECGPDKIFY